MFDRRFPLCKKAGLDVSSGHLLAITVEAFLASAPVVYRHEMNGIEYAWTHDKDPGNTHTARLIMMEPIKKKSREEKLEEFWVLLGEININHIIDGISFSAAAKALLEEKE